MKYNIYKIYGTTGQMGQAKYINLKNIPNDVGIEIIRYGTCSHNNK